MVRHNWAEARAYYHDASGALRSLSLEWTDLAPGDPFVEMSADRALFRVTDLLELTQLVAVLDRETSE